MISDIQGEQLKGTFLEARTLYLVRGGGETFLQPRVDNEYLNSYFDVRNNQWWFYQNKIFQMQRKCCDTH